MAEASVRTRMDRLEADRKFYDPVSDRYRDVALDALARMEAAEREGGWMRRVFLAMDSVTWMRFVEGPWYATGDMDELAFFRALRDERVAALAREEKP